MEILCTDHSVSRTLQAAICYCCYTPIYIINECTNTLQPISKQHYRVATKPTYGSNNNDPNPIAGWENRKSGGISSSSNKKKQIKHNGGEKRNKKNGEKTYEKRNIDKANARSDL